MRALPSLLAVLAFAGSALAEERPVKVVPTSLDPPAKVASGTSVPPASGPADTILAPDRRLVEPAVNDQAKRRVMILMMMRDAAAAGSPALFLLRPTE